MSSPDAAYSALLGGELDCERGAFVGQRDPVALQGHGRAVGYDVTADRAVDDEIEVTANELGIAVAIDLGAQCDPLTGTGHLERRAQSRTAVGRERRAVVLLQ